MTAALPLPAADAPARPRAADLLRHGLYVIAFNTVIAIALGLSRGRWDQQFVYSYAVGLSIWALIEGGRCLIPVDARTGWPRGARLVALQAVGIGGGFVIGTGIGDAYVGQSTWALWRLAPEALAGLLTMAVGLSVAISWFFYSQGRDRRREAELAAARHAAVEAQLQLLQSQLEPHMLFNTLANLRALIGVDAPRAQGMVDQLIAFLRSTLAASRRTQHPLSLEFDRLRDYLALMQVRMGPRLTSTLSLPPELAGASVPTLLLQPLVENAIRHGLEPQVASGRIAVGAWREGDRLWLEVLDDGAGVSPLGGPAMPSRHASGSGPSRAAGSGFGLQQVRERLATLHGGHAGLSIGPGPEGGTRVRLHLPLVFEDRAAA